MRITSVFIGIVGIVASLETSANPDDPSGLWKKIPAMYKVHSGGVSDRVGATRSDRKLTVLITGQPAKEVFDNIGVDVRNPCESGPKDRVRAKKGVYCQYEAELADPRDHHYRCWIGIDLRTGNTSQTVSC